MPLRVMLVAGGTGGHLFPALALREALIARRHTVILATDNRVKGYVDGVPPESHHTVRSASVSTSNPIKLARSAIVMLQGTLESRALMQQTEPNIVVGFGGYPTVPPLLAAKLTRRPTLVHDQNVVVGRANRLLIKLGSHLAHGFPNPVGVSDNAAKTLVGNPVRSAVLEAAGTPYQSAKQTGDFNLLIFGGSQGARVFSERIPEAISLLPDDLRRRLRITQQSRPEDLESSQAAFDKLSVSAELRPFYADMPSRIERAHFVISRAGASTISELSTIGRPALLVPYPHALDHDQAANAASLEEAGAAILIREADLTPQELASQLQFAMTNPDEMIQMAAASKSAGQSDAVDKLVNLVERLAR